MKMKYKRTRQEHIADFALAIAMIAFTIAMLAITRACG